MSTLQTQPGEVVDGRNRRRRPDAGSCDKTAYNFQRSVLCE